MGPQGGRGPSRALDARSLHFGGAGVGRTVRLHHVPHSTQCAPVRPHAMGLGTAGAFLRHALLLRLRQGLSGRAAVSPGSPGCAAVHESRFARLLQPGWATLRRLRSDLWAERDANVVRSNADGQLSRRDEPDWGWDERGWDEPKRRRLLMMRRRRRIWGENEHRSKMTAC